MINSNRKLSSATCRAGAPLVKTHESNTDVETSPLDKSVLDAVDRWQRHLHAVCFDGSDDLGFVHARTNQLVNDGTKIIGHGHDVITLPQGDQYIDARMFVPPAGSDHHYPHGEETTHLQRAHRGRSQALSRAMAWRPIEPGCALQALHSEGPQALRSEPFAYIERPARGWPGCDRGNSPRSRHTKSVAAR